VAEEREGIFRKQALERMSSPDRLDQLIQIVSPKDWLLLGTFLTVGLLLIAWCIWGQLPTTVSGQGMLVRPRKIVEIQSQAAGKLVNLKLRVREEINAGDVLGAIDQAETRKLLEEDRGRLAVLEAQDREKSSLQQQQARLQDRDFEAQKHDLQLQIANREESIRNGETLAGVLKKRLDALREAIQVGIEPKVSSDLLQTEKAYLENQARISQLQTERSEVESQIKQLDTRRTELSRTLLEASTNRRNQILELRRNIALNEIQLEKGTRIVSEYSGRVVEIAASPGQVLSAGSRLAYVEVHESADDLGCVMYFPVRDGKRIRPGMKIQATPDSVKRERFGGIVGKVTTVSGFPVTKEGATLMLGNAELASRMLKDEPQIEVLAELERDKTTYSGYKWSSSKGPRMSITSGTTTSGRVTVEMRSPITYLLPFLRGMSGVD
jgi:HlyD family secretion protein